MLLRKLIVRHANISRSTTRCAIISKGSRNLVLSPKCGSRLQQLTPSTVAKTDAPLKCWMRLIVIFLLTEAVQKLKFGVSGVLKGLQYS